MHDTDAASSEPLQPPSFDEARLVRQAGMFEPFLCPNSAVPLVDAHLAPNAELILFECNGAMRALRLVDMGWHHVAQGQVGGEPFAVAFCGVCHSGACFTPVVKDETLQLQARAEQRACLRSTESLHSVTCS